MKIKNGLIALLVLFMLFPSASSAAKKKKKAPTGKVCLASDGESLRVAKNCSASETKLGLSQLQGAQGPQGPAGNDGAAGVLDVANCRTVLELGAIVGTDDIGQVIADCDSSEFLLTHGGTATDADVDILGVNLRVFTGEGYAAGVAYTFGRNNVNDTQTATISAAAVCCPE